MNDKELIGVVHSSVYHQCQKRGYAAPVDVLMDIGVLSKENYENWRFGRIPYLEKVCSINLRKLAFVLNQIRSYANKSGYKNSYTFYKQWGRKRDGSNTKTVPLRFSKSGNPIVERAYATHYIDQRRITELKRDREEKESSDHYDKKSTNHQDTHRIK